MRRRKDLLLLSLAYVMIAVLAAQTPGDWQTAAGGKMAFEVASIKLAKPVLVGSARPTSKMGE
jgi:hypothetical protein